MARAAASRHGADDRSMAGRLKVALEARAAGCMHGDAAADHRGDRLGASHARQCVAPV
ncbi:protein of unknown function [Cupriavidus neocaledonicus]|uniref:Uncharacterized protein n=1 Tax=Cupriavidus neocaledonicus TaxID=1040979 RepID=A0A375H402_9BURK|nr:hypothetical protein CBM2605_A160060 [Cupriavidus neocaledonicus]SPD46964.1 protein of unknown function [Cupriavidus neocaledonicus]